MTSSQTTEITGINHAGHPVTVTLPVIDGITITRDRSETDPKTPPVRFGTRTRKHTNVDAKCSVDEAISAFREALT